MKKIHLHRYQVISLLFSSIFLSSCGGPPIVRPSERILVLTVYRVFGPDDDHQFPSDNSGCQLTDAKVIQIVDDFIASAPFIYDANIDVIWESRNPIDVVDTMMHPDRSLQDIFTFEWILGSSGIYPDYPNSSDVNIFFAGNYNSAVLKPGEDVGLTIDPHEIERTDTTGLGKGFIIINDGGGSLSPGGGDVNLLIDRATLPHEVGHYLGRFNFDIVTSNGNIPPVERVYHSGFITERTFDIEEHIIIQPTPGINNHHIMISGEDLAANELRPRVLPGVTYPLYDIVVPPAPLSNSQYGAEIGEVSRKLYLIGGYNDYHR